MTTRIDQGTKGTPLRENERTILIAVLLGVFVDVGPNIVGVLLSNSVSLLASLLSAMGELFATFLSWATVRRVARGKDLNFNYGYGKLENLTSLVVVAAMVMAFAEVLQLAIERIRHPVAIEGVGIGLLVSIPVLLCDLWVFLRSRRQLQKGPSPIMDSHTALYKLKVIAGVSVVTPFVLGALLKDYTWSMYLDPIASLILCWFILVTAYQTVLKSIPELLDRTLEEPLQILIVGTLAEYFDAYQHLHGIRARRSGGTIFIEIFIEFAGDDRMDTVYAVIARMQASLQLKIPGSEIAIVPATHAMS